MYWSSNVCVTVGVVGLSMGATAAVASVGAAGGLLARLIYE